MTFEEVIINKLIADSLHGGKIRVKRRQKDEYVIQARIGGAWLTLNSIYAKRPSLKEVSND